MLTIVFTPKFGNETVATSAPYQVLKSPTVHVIFWGPDWWDGKGTPTTNQVDYHPYKNEVSSILSSQYFTGLTEYGSNGKIGKVDYYAIDNDNVPSDFGDANADAEVTELEKLVSDKHVAGPGDPPGLLAAPIYLFITDPYHSPTDADGFNWWSTISPSGQVADQWVNLIEAGTSASQDFGATIAHEMVEKTTDPLAGGTEDLPDTHGVLVAPGPNTPTNVAELDDATTHQICDGEPEGYSYDLGGDSYTEAQAFWSANTLKVPNQAKTQGAYVIPDGNLDLFTLTPDWTISTDPATGDPSGSFNNTYGLTIYGGQNGITNDQITISTDKAGGVEVNLNGQIAYFDPSTDHSYGTPLRSITVNGLTGDDTLTVDFTNGDPIPSGGIKFNGADGTNTIQTTGDGSFVLSNGNLKRGSDTIKLSNVQTANLTGGDGADTFDVSGWTGTGRVLGSLSGLGGTDTLISTKSGTQTLDGNGLTTSDGMQMVVGLVVDVDLFGKSGADTFTVNGWGNVTLDGKGGNDTYNLSAPVNKGTITNTVTDSGSGDVNTLNINDESNTEIAGTTIYTASYDGVGHIVRVGHVQNSHKGGGRNASDLVSVSYSNVKTVNINADNRGNQFNVSGIGQGTEVVYKAGTGGDAVKAGSDEATLDAIAGTLTVNGQGNTTLTLDDHINTNSEILVLGGPPLDVTTSPAYTITESKTTRVNTVNGAPRSPNTFNYSKLASLTIIGGQSANAFDVAGLTTTGAIALPSSFPISIDGGADDDTFTTQGWRDTVQFNGEGGNDTYNVKYALNPGAVTIADSGTGDANVLNINDQQDADLANTVAYTATVGQIRRNGQSRQLSRTGRATTVNDTAVVADANVATVNVNPYNMGNKLTVLAIGLGTDLVYNAGTGSDAVTAGGSANDLDAIAGTLTVNGQGNTTLKLDDAPERSDSSSSSPVYTITDTTVTHVDTVNGTVLGPNTFVYNNLASLTIDGGRLGNLFNVQSTAATIPVSINAGRGDDTVHIGSASDTLDGIKSLVTVNGQQGVNTLNIFDDGTTGTQYYDLLANQFTRTPTTPGQPLGNPTQTLNFQKFTTVAARLGSAQDVDGVTSTAAGTSYSLDLGTGFNEVLVGSNNDTLDTLQGALTIHGNRGNSLLDLIDELNPVGHNYTMSSDPISGNHVDRDQMADISYDGIGELILATGDNPYTPTTPSTVDVTGTAANMFTIAVVTTGDTVTLGAPVGNGSTHTLQGFLGGFRVQSTAAETPSVLIDDSGDTSTVTRTVSFESYPSSGYYIDGLAPQDIYVATGTGSSVAVRGDNADETFKVNALPPGVAFSLNAEGGVNTLDYSGWTGDVTVDLPRGYATGFSGGISNIRNVVGSNGNNILVGDAQANVLTGGSGRNILIGGAGADILNGGAGQNILIGGTTDDDLDITALDAVMAAWPVGDATFAAAAHADGAADTLNGGGQNWFLFAPGEDQIVNPQPGDLTTPV